MTRYSAKGTIELGREVQPFEVNVEGASEKQARENLYSLLGSRHSVSRAKISLESLNEVE